MRISATIMRKYLGFCSADVKFYATIKFYAIISGRLPEEILNVTDHYRQNLKH